MVTNFLHDENKYRRQTYLHILFIDSQAGLAENIKYAEYIVRS